MRLTVLAGAVFSLFVQAAAMADYDIIPIIGQSNAVGRGLGTFPALLENQDTKIRQLGRSGDDNLQVIEVGQTSNGVKWDGLQHWDSRPETMGFALTFARYYARYNLAPGRTVLLIPGAYGGTSILEWLGDDPIVPLYPDIKERINYALALPGRNKVVVLLWHQGEADLLASMSPAAYQSNLTEFWSTFRYDFPGGYPIVTARLAPSYRPSDTNKQLFDRAIARAAAADPMAFVAKTHNLTSNGEVVSGSDDKVHFSAKAQISLAKRMYIGFTSRWPRLSKW